MKVTTIIGITARKGVGKSTLATMLAEQIYGAQIVGFADALKDDVALLVARETSIRADNVRPWLDARKATVFGPLLQGWGELMREWHGREYWIEQVADYIEFDQPAAVIVPDVRYENEVAWIKAEGGLLVAIEGPCRWAGDTRDDSHPSETGVEACAKLADITIFNNADLEYLRQRAEGIARVAQGVAV